MKADDVCSLLIECDCFTSWKPFFNEESYEKILPARICVLDDSPFANSFMLINVGKVQEAIKSYAYFSMGYYPKSNMALELRNSEPNWNNTYKAIARCFGKSIT